MLLLGLFVGFLVVERLRGSISLARYLRALAVQGEGVNADDFRPRARLDENGAPEVLAAAKALIPGTVLPRTYPPRMRLTASGRAIVGFREEEWVEAKVTNHWEQLAADLQANEATLERIRTAMAKPVLSCNFDPSLGLNARFPHLAVPKSLAQWLGPRIELRLHEGRPHDTVADLVTEIDLPRLLASDKIVISELVRIAVAAIALCDTWEALQADGWTDADLGRLQSAWEQQEFIGGMVRALEGERVFAQSSYRTMRKSNEEAVGNLFGMLSYLRVEDKPQWERWASEVPGGDTAIAFARNQVYCRLWRFAWLDQDELRYLQYLHGLIALGRDATREKSFHELDSRLTDLMLRFQNRGLYDRLRYPSVLSVESLSRVLRSAMRAETERSLVLAAIALKRYSLRRGASPTSLSALVPEVLPTVPVDYMDGRPLKFRTNADGGFVLYSVGEDGKDNGGDTGMLPDKTNRRRMWERKDFVWPAPATAEELKVYRAEAAKN